MPAEGLSIVTYHGVLPEGYKVLDSALDGSLVHAKDFRRQLRLLRDRYNVISSEQMLAWCDGKIELPPRAVLVTCDDGLINVVTDMLPILREEGIPCLFFVIGLSSEDTPQMLWYEELYLMLAAAGEGPFSFRFGDVEIFGVPGSQSQRRALWQRMTQILERYDHERCAHFIGAVRARLGLAEDFAAAYLREPISSKRFRLLGPADLRTLLDSGMSVGAHTLSHPALSNLSEDRAWFEIVEGRRRLEKTLGREVWAFAYPFGGPVSVSEREFNLASKAGYKAAFLSFGGGLGASLPRYALPRIHVAGDMRLAEFEAHVSGFYRNLRGKFVREEKCPLSPAA
jgi:peptidoglycan/xylan/chitin deacetylase (PgdA/CDA1 family)